MLQRLIRETYPASIDNRPGCWYLRAASPARLIGHIAPALERRLVDSGANRYTGRIAINFYDTSGLELVFGQGRITARDIEIGEEERFQVDAGLPPHALLNLVCGYNDLDELYRVLPDTKANAKTAALFAELFPRKHSQLWAIWLSAAGQMSI